MNDSKVLFTHSLHISFHQLEDGSINWSVVPDEVLENTLHLSTIDLVERGAPLAVLGIRNLWKLCVNGTIYSSLELANSIRREIGSRLASGAEEMERLQPPEGVTIN